MATTARYRYGLYFLVNTAFVFLVAMLSATSVYQDPRTLYVILLFALCSSVIIDLDGFNGRYSLMAVFAVVYFVSFGVGDLTNLLPGAYEVASPVSNLLSSPEMVILAGGTMWLASYRLALTLAAKRPDKAPKDWSKGAILAGGSVLWALGTIALYRWNVYILKDTTNEDARKALASLSPAVTMAYIACQMCQPLGILLLAYASTVYRSRFLLLMFLGMTVIQIFIGFVVDIKGVALYGIILAIITSLLVNGRVPKAWLAFGVVFVTAVYPYFTAYRAAIHANGIARTTVVENFGAILAKTIAAKDKVNSGPDRAQTFLERSNVKNSVEVIVRKTGDSVAFQNGHTLAPILAAFIPRIIWADKEAVPTGQLFNKQFKLFDNDDIWVSPSYLGEMYWNFGWPGALLGMSFLGVTCGWVAARFNIGAYVTVTRLLVTVVTIKQLIVAFEGVVGDNITVWIRSLAAIGILHLLFARISARSRLMAATNAQHDRVDSDQRATARPFPNLLS